MVEVDGSIAPVGVVLVEPDVHVLLVKPDGPVLLVELGVGVALMEVVLVLDVVL